MVSLAQRITLAIGAASARAIAARRVSASEARTARRAVARPDGRAETSARRAARRRDAAAVGRVAGGAHFRDCGPNGIG